MISSLVMFLHDRSPVSGNFYSLGYMFYYGLLLAVGTVAIARFPVRGSIMAAIMLIYAAVTIIGYPGLENVPRGQPPSNLNLIRLLLLIAYLSLLFNCLLSASSRMGRRKP